jgi:hypothetical protein
MATFAAESVMGVDAEVCAICGRPFTDVYYTFEDKVTLEKRHVCRKCEQSFPECFVCSLPANTNATGFVQLPDQRALCSRDARTAVLREEDGVLICREVRDRLDRLLSRFTSFPETNVTVEVMDRVNLQTLFKLAGNDYHCPNVWGLTATKTNLTGFEYRISIMTGLPLSWFQATCAHEYGHTWVGEHLTLSRRSELDPDSEEGFCELVAFLFMESIHDQAQQSLILHNAYTRGQIDLFVAAQRSYGFNEVLDWMQFGTDDRLSTTDPGRIRKVVLPRPNAKPERALPLTQKTHAPAPATLVLRAIFWDQKRPLAMINGHLFGLNEEAKVRLGATNVVVHCVGIAADAVQVRVAGEATQQTLRLREQ